MIKLKKPSELLQTVMNCIMLNKGNTCYINALLQSFNSMVKLWTSFSLDLDTLSPFVSSFVRTTSMLKSKQFKIHPSFYVACKSLGKVLFICFSKDLHRECSHGQEMPKPHWKTKLFAIISSRLYGMKSQCQFSIYM